MAVDVGAGRWNVGDPPGKNRVASSAELALVRLDCSARDAMQCCMYSTWRLPRAPPQPKPPRARTALSLLDRGSVGLAGCGSSCGLCRYQRARTVSSTTYQPQGCTSMGLFGLHLHTHHRDKRGDSDAPPVPPRVGAAAPQQVQVRLDFRLSSLF